MDNAEKARWLHFGGLQADGAGLRDGSLGFLAPRLTLGSHQADRSVKHHHPSSARLFPGSTSSAYQYHSPTLRAQSLSVELTPNSAAKAEGLHPG